MTTPIKFVVYRDRKGLFRWRALRVGRVVADSGEGYSGKGHVNRALKAFLKAVFNENYIVVYK